LFALRFGREDSAANEIGMRAEEGELFLVRERLRPLHTLPRAVLRRWRMGAGPPRAPRSMVSARRPDRRRARSRRGRGR
jgi:hypothetical protein